jgi:hypothetical protein
MQQPCQQHLVPQPNNGQMAQPFMPLPVQQAAGQVPSPMPPAGLMYQQAQQTPGTFGLFPMMTQNGA